MAHTPAHRLEAARDLDEMRGKGAKAAPLVTKEQIIYGSDGRVMQTNEGKWTYHWKDSQNTINLSISISKFLDTSQIQVDVHPKFILLTIKTKFLRLVFDEEVRPSTMYCERSRLTGELSVTIGKASAEGTYDVSANLSKISVSTPLALPSLVAVPKSKSALLDYRNIVRDAKLPIKLGDGIKFKSTMQVGNITEQPHIVESKDFIDDNDVPPLC